MSRRLVIVVTMMAVGSRLSSGPRLPLAGGEPPNAVVHPVVTGADSVNPVVARFGGARLDLWSLRPIRPVATPDSVGEDSYVDHPIDRFLLDRGLGTASRLRSSADLRTLARRAAFQLTGLPPNTERLRELLADDRPEAFARYVDELLAAPAYGVHWARMWLDVVRYSDSNGFDWDEFRPEAWRFRDYVVDSLNADKPFDQFLTEQLAGDELLAGPPQTSEEQQALLATGYLRLGPHDNAAPLFNEQDRSRAELLTDLVETTGSAFLGLTLSCCRCHDHKTDPLLQADHYRLRAFFEAVRPVDDLAIDLAPIQRELTEHNQQVTAAVEEIATQREQLLLGVKLRLREGGHDSPTEADLDRALTADERLKKDRSLRREQELRSAQRRPTYALLMSDAPGEISATHVLLQGDHLTPGEVVNPGIPAVFQPGDMMIMRGANPQTSGRRLTLARWVADPANPLTRRVIVNRVWQSLFGWGLVATPNDFGLSGATPTHPELLDWLADQFLRDGWSLKSLQRQIVLSAVWRQVSLATTVVTIGDTGNHAADRHTPRRLSAEQLRDAVLATAGLLTDKHSGPPVWPALPAEILQANPAFLDDNETRTKGWYSSPANDQHCRSLYLVQKRGVRIPFLELFDLPENMVSCGVRTTSTVAPQALALLNSELAVAVSEGLARRITGQAGDDRDQQIPVLFELALQRNATPAEQVECRQFLAEHSLEDLCRVILNLNEFAYLD